MDHFSCECVLNFVFFLVIHPTFWEKPFLWGFLAMRSSTAFSSGFRSGSVSSLHGSCDVGKVASMQGNCLERFAAVLLRYDAKPFLWKSWKFAAAGWIGSRDPIPLFCFLPDLAGFRSHPAHYEVKERSNSTRFASEDIQHFASYLFKRKTLRKVRVIKLKCAPECEDNITNTSGNTKPDEFRIGNDPESHVLNRHGLLSTAFTSVPVRFADKEKIWVNKGSVSDP